MTPLLLRYLCDPQARAPMQLCHARHDAAGNVISGELVSVVGRRYSIVDGIPRFAEDPAERSTVAGFGDEWNALNFDAFRLNWLQHTVKNTFGATEAFAGKLVVDAGAGSGMQSRWLSEAGARHVIALELSHAVDGVMRRNLENVPNVDVVQCSIDRPPLRDACIDGMVICHNVIQHTRSVEDTAHALWRVVAPGGELVFNCYLRTLLSGR